MITTRDKGSIKIRNIKPGDILLTLDKKEGVVETIVKKIHRRNVPVEEIVGVSFKQNPTIFCTDNHKFYIKNRGFVEAEDLKRGMIIMSSKSKKAIK